MTAAASWLANELRESTSSAHMPAPVHTTHLLGLQPHLILWVNGGHALDNGKQPCTSHTPFAEVTEHRCRLHIRTAAAHMVPCVHKRVCVCIGTVCVSAWGGGGGVSARTWQFERKFHTSPGMWFAAIAFMSVWGRGWMKHWASPLSERHPSPRPCVAAKHAGGFRSFHN